MRPLFDSGLAVRGKDCKRYDNQARAGLDVGQGGAMLGGSWAGPVGALIGFKPAPRPRGSSSKGSGSTGGETEGAQGDSRQVVRRRR